MSKKSRRSAPREPYQPEFDLQEPKRETYKLKVAYLLDPEETAALVVASSAPYEETPIAPSRVEHETYSQEEAVALITGTPLKRKKRKKSSETITSS